MEGGRLRQAEVDECIVADTKCESLREAEPPQDYVPTAQAPVTAQHPEMAVMFAAADPAGAQRAVRRMLQTTRPGTDIFFYNYEQEILDHLVGDRMMAGLAGFFGILATLLVVVGLHGVLSHFVAQRRGEIGIRMRWEPAAGASSREPFWVNRMGANVAKESCFSERVHSNAL